MTARVWKAYIEKKKSRDYSYGNKWRTFFEFALVLLSEKRH